MRVTSNGGDIDAHGGERTALGLLPPRIPEARRAAQPVLRDRATAEDLAQETLGRVWRRWEHVRRLGRPELWARCVALNLANSWFRSRRAAIRALTRSAAFVDGAPSPVDSDGDFLGMVASLAPCQRTALVVRFYEEPSVTDTGRLMRCREGTVKALTSQALDTLRGRGIPAEDLDHE